MSGLRKEDLRLRREHLDEVAKEYGIPVLAQIPIRPAIAKAVDEGTVEYVEADFLDDAVKAVKEA